MNALRQLTPAEVMFVGGETVNVYQHTAGLILLDGSKTPGFGFERYRRHLEQRLELVPNFRWRLHEVPLGLDLPYWVEDENFSFDHHIRRIAVPSPGDRKALVEVVSYLYCRHLDRKRPMWEIWFIEGLADGRYAVLQKLHHCMMDGEGASKLTSVMCDFEPDAALPEIDSSITDAQPGQIPERWQQSLNTALHAYRMPIQLSREIYELVRHSLARRITDNGGLREKPVTPTTRFNGDIGSERGFVFGSLPLADIKAVKNHFDVTVNEVVLAVVGGSMRNYLQQQQGGLPDESLRTYMAVSLRTDADDDFSNKVTTTTVTLATDTGDARQRLQRIAADSERAKSQAHHGGRGLMEFIQALPPLLVNTLIRLTPADRVASMTGGNLVVSSVRGSDKPMYVAGARISAMYPMSIITPGGGMNITCLSYADNIDFGITIAPDAVPDPWLLIDGLHEALDEYVSMLGKRSSGRKRTPATSKTTKRKRKTTRRQTR